MFDLKVERVRILWNQPGDLHIDSAGVTFRSSDGKTAITIPMSDLREADVADPHTLRFEIYFRSSIRLCAANIRSARHRMRLSRYWRNFLAARPHRPVVGNYDAGPASAGSQFRVAAYHRQTFGGADGTLEIGRDSIRFVGDKPADSRTWLYRDIETIGRPDSFRYRVTTSRETYILELKADLPEAAYQFAWSKVYNLEWSGK